MIASMHVVPSILEEAAGPSYAIPRLCRVLSALGDTVKLHCLDTAQADGSFDVCTYPRWEFPKRLGVSPQMFHALQAAADSAEIMHNHSLWMMPNIYSGWATRSKKCRLVTSPHGTLAPWAWARSRWVKRLIWPLQKEVLFRADCLHATAEAELQHMRQMGLRAPVALIPFGIDIPVICENKRNDRLRELLFFGRIHPTKGVDLLLQVWSRLEKNNAMWRLRIVGPDNGGYLKQMERLATELRLTRVSFEGPVYGDAKYHLLSSADLYVLPTHTENFGFTVAEALACGVPAIVTTGAPWSGLVTNKCGWWISRDEQSLYITLQEAMLLPDVELRAMGMNGRDWMQRDFSWEEIGRRMHLTYEWLLGGGTPPGWVETV